MVRPASRSTATKPTVLLVQHDADNREMYAEFLQHKGLTPVCASTGADALRAAPTADIVVTGMLLAGDMDGLELIGELRAADETRAIPIIVLTACAWKTERERAERAGCDLFLPKPCAPDELVREISRVLAASRLGRVRGKPAATRATRRGSRRPA